MILDWAKDDDVPIHPTTHTLMSCPGYPGDVSVAIPRNLMRLHQDLNEIMIELNGDLATDEDFARTQMTGDPWRHRIAYAEALLHLLRRDEQAHAPDPRLILSN